MNEITLNLPADLANHLALMAQRTGRDESTLALESLRIYLEREQEQVAELQRAVEEADAGDFASDEEVQALLGNASWHQAAIAEGLADIDAGRHTNLETIKAYWDKRSKPL